MNSGNLLFQNRFKSEKRSSCMEDRIGFADEPMRKKFFSTVREISGAKSWKDISVLLGLRRTQFQQYQYGQLLLPKRIFDLMAEFLPKEKQDFFKTSIFAKPSNWGAVKGGLKNFEKNKEALLEHLGQVRYKSVPRPVNLSQPLSKDLCELIGAIIGDGCVDGHIRKNGTSAYHLSITGDAERDKDYLTNKIPSIISSLFNIQTHIYPKKDCRAIALNFNSKQVFSLFTKRFGFPAGAKAFTVKIPEEIMQAGEEFIFPAIRGIFDTDGCVFFDKRKKYCVPYPRITLQVVSEPLFLQLKQFLSKHFSLYARSGIKRHNYCVEVYGHKQLEKWMRLIGFSNRRHLSKIDNYKLSLGIGPRTST